MEAISCWWSIIGEVKTPSKMKVFLRIQMRLAREVTKSRSSGSKISMNLSTRSKPSVTVKANFWIDYLHSIQTAIADLQLHRVWTNVLGKRPQIGHKGSEIIPFLNRLFLVGRIFLQTCQIKVLTTPETFKRQILFHTLLDCEIFELSPLSLSLRSIPK